MPRRNSAVKKDVLPDPIYNNKVVTKLINQVMMSGKKGLAQRIVYGAFDIIKEKTSLEPLDVCLTAIENVKPQLETKGRRVGGATYQVPIPIRPERRQTLAIRWIVNNARKRTAERTMDAKLAGELIDAYNNTGSSIKKRDEMHRMAEANKAFAHYNW